VNTREQAGDIFARAPALAVGLQLEGLAPIHRVGPDFDHHLVGPGLDLRHLGELDLARPRRYHCLQRSSPSLLDSTGTLRSRLWWRKTALSTLGQSLGIAVATMRTWAYDHMDEISAARDDYDARD
jgi:hypothetical protein